MPTTVSTPRKIVATVSANATLAKGRHTPVDATSGALTLTLPTDAAAGVEVSVEKIDTTGNVVTISGTLRGVTSSTITLTTQFEARTFLSEGAGSWRPTSDHRTQTALDGSYVRPDLVAIGSGIDPTGAADSTTALQAKINATPSGGRLYIPRGTYTISAALTIPRSMSIEGNSVTPTFGTGDNITPTTPFLSGTVIKQTTAATDVIKISATGVTPNLKNLGLMFASGLSSTGHGVNATPSAAIGSGHDIGAQSFVWDSVYVYGHDGNHYGFVLLNTQYGTASHCRSYGGGGWSVTADPGSINSGNLVLIHPYVAILNVGTAGGYVHSGLNTTPGTLNLLTYIRPQVICGSPAANAATNPLWDDLAGAGVPRGVAVYGADFETAGANLFRPGSGTAFTATSLVNGMNTSNTRAGAGALPNWTGGTYGSSNTAYGSNALAANTTGANNTALGSVLGVNTTGSNNTGVGNIALNANTTGGANTAVGKAALLVNVTNSSNTAVGFEALKSSTADNNTAVGGVALQNVTTGNNDTAVGSQALQALTTGSVNVAVGQSAGIGVTTGSNNTHLGHKAGVTTVGGNQVTTASQTTFVGCFSGPGSASQFNGATAMGYQASTGGNNAVAIGVGVSAGASGAVAIGHDSASGAANTTTANAFVLGTPLHLVQIRNNTTGAGSAALGANSPAVTPAAPYTWFKMLSDDGSVVFVPAWK